MKTILLSVILLGLSPLVSAQADLVFQLNNTLPQGIMAGRMAKAWGASGQVLYRFPESRFALGGEMGINSYGEQCSRQTYRFTDGSTTETDVHVGNDFAQFNVVGRVDLRAGGGLMPYAIAKVGYMHYWTNLNIANPADPTNCHPLENTTLLEDGALAGTLGAGVRWDVSGLFKKLDTRRYWLDVSAEYMTGGRVRFMNVNLPPATTHQHQVPAGGPDPFSARFINPQTQVVHEHHVGDVYNAPIENISLRFGFVMRIGE